MGNVRASHQIGVIPNDCLTLNASMNRDELTDYATVPNPNAKAFAFAAVLRRCTNDGSSVNRGVLAYRQWPIQADVWPNLAIAPKDHISLNVYTLVDIHSQ
jgi:hypothetical protein